MPAGRLVVVRSVTSGGWMLVIVVVAVLGFGLYRAAANGRFTGTHRVRGVHDASAATMPAPGGVLAGTSYAAQLGERATLLQFSSTFCAPCRVARRVLSEVAADAPGVSHVEIDAEHHLDLVRRLGVTRTPTTLVLDASGIERGRAAGAPTRTQVESALAEAGP
jgi:thiol-disulfide isomerase/thioredoxin